MKKKTFEGVSVYLSNDGTKIIQLREDGICAVLSGFPGWIWDMWMAIERVSKDALWEFLDRSIDWELLYGDDYTESWIVSHYGEE